MAKREKIRFFKTLKSRLLVVSVLFLIAGILLPVFITSGIYGKQIQAAEEESTMQSFSRAASRINEMLAAASLSAFRVQDEAIVNQYLLS